MGVGGGSLSSVESKLKNRKYYIYNSKDLTGKTESNIKSNIQIDDSFIQDEREFNISQDLENFINTKIGNSPPKYNLNILFYDENLKKNDENKDICTFFEMNLNGTFYGCHYFELFEKVCEKIRRNKAEFILISSGASAEKIFDYCSKMKEIGEYYIYCSEKEKYIHLIDKFTQLKGIYNTFNDLKKKLHDIDEIKNDNISSSNLIYFEDYSQKYIKLHYEFIRKYSLYKLLKQENYNEEEFLKLVEKQFPYFLDLAKQLFPDKNEVINFFKNNTETSEDTIKNVFNFDDNILNDNIKFFVRNYTAESFYYKYLNIFLRKGNFEAFRILSSHISKFIFKLYDYRNKIISKQKKDDLYRKMYLKPKEIEQYEQSIGKVICYPSFTSTSIYKNKYMPKKYNYKDELALLIIEQNKTKSVVLISEFSNYPNEEEYLFLPFSFFKIKNFKRKKGTKDDPHIIYLVALNTEKPIEEMFYDFMIKETDNLSPEGLDLLLLNNSKTKIVFNSIYFSNHDDNNCCGCNIFCH